MSFYTPLRYPGGKGKLALYLKAIIVENDIQGCSYAEVYAGGAGVALELLVDGYVSDILINDLNLHIHSFWTCVLDHTDELCRLIDSTEVTIDEWHRQKSIYAAGEEVSLVDRAFATFFLNRTNRSGIMKGGVIGGKAQDGKWKLDARFNKRELLARIQRIAMLRDRIAISRLDGLEFIEQKAKYLPPKAIMYLDPPYYVKGEGLYDNFYSHDDHVRVSAALGLLQNVNWVVSYDNAPQIESMYSAFRSIKYSLSYSAAERYRAAEAMFFAPTLKKIPLLEDYGYRLAA